MNLFGGPTNDALHEREFSVRVWRSVRTAKTVEKIAAFKYRLDLPIGPDGYLESHRCWLLPFSFLPSVSFGFSPLSFFCAAAVYPGNAGVEQIKSEIRVSAEMVFHLSSIN